MRFPKHPFPVRTVFRRCLLANVAVSPAALAAVLPSPLEPEVHDGEAFVSVVVGRMDRMRPAFVPGWLGISYDQIVYRAVVRVGDERGVHFLRSDADNGLMCALGSAMSFFRFHRSAIDWRERGWLLDLDVTTADGTADIHATYDLAGARRTLPRGSSFRDLDQAKRWLVELYTAFDHTAGRPTVDVIRIDRGEWDVRVVDDQRAGYGFFTGSLAGRLDAVFLVGDVPYRWHRLEHLPVSAGTTPSPGARRPPGGRRAGRRS